MNIKKIAETIRKADKSKTACSPIRQYLKRKDLQTAYQIQKINIDYHLENGQQEVGKKIGLTSKKVQAQLGVNQPDFGILLSNMQVKNGAEIPFPDLMQPKAEAEIAFVLKKDLLDKNITIDDIIDAVDYVCAAIEIVGSRIENWDIQITDTIADNASSSHFVLGNKKVSLEDLDLKNCRMKLYKNNELVSEGNGKACLGNPLNAVVWLAKKMVELDNPLKKGEVILSGALGPMIKINQGDIFKAEIDGFDTVKFSIS